MKPAPPGASTTASTIIRLSSSACGASVGDELGGGHDPLAAQDPVGRRQAEQVVEVRVRAEVAGVAVRVGPVEVHEGDVERQRRHRDQLLAVGVRGADGAQPTRDVRAEPGARRQERQPLRRGAQPGDDHALVELHDLDRAGRPGPRRTTGRTRSSPATRSRRPVRAPSRPRTAARRPGPPNETTRRSRTGVSQQRAHQRHRLAPRAPAADADGHPVLDRRDRVRRRRALVTHCGSRTRRGARRRRRPG